MTNKYGQVYLIFVAQYWMIAQEKMNYLIWRESS